MSHKPTLYWADRLRNIATLFVVMIHAAAPVAFGSTDLDSAGWWAGNFWNSLSRVGVPLFVMLSGFLLLGKDYDLIDFLKRRFSKVVIPALFWMVVYSLYNYTASGQPATIKDAIKNIVENGVHYHLWFIYLIIGLYMVYPILRPWVRSAKDRDFIYFFLMWAFGTWGYKSMNHFFDIQIGIYFELFTNNCGYFVMGYYLGHKSLLSPENEHSNANIEPWKLTHQQVLWMAWALIIGSTAFTMFASYALNTWYDNGGKFQSFFYDYLTPNVCLGSFGWFLLAKWQLNNKPLLPIEQEFSNASYGIYFIHVLVMDWWGKNGYWHSQGHPALAIPILIPLVFLVSFMVVIFIRTFPGGHRIT